MGAKSVSYFLLTDCNYMFIFYKMNIHTIYYQYRAYFPLDSGHLKMAEIEGNFSGFVGLQS